MFKDILVHLDHHPDCANRLTAAIDLANRYQAHLTGLYLTPSLIVPMPYGMDYVAGDILEDRAQEIAADRERIKTRFEQQTAEAGCAAEWHQIDSVTGQQLLQQTGCTDLVIVGQTRPHEPLTDTAPIIDQIILGTPVPVLVIPYIGTRPTLGERIMVAWNGGREAARAVHGALPLLSVAEQVEVVAVNPPASAGDIATADICRHLARHGVHANGSDLTADDIDVGNLLLSRIADQGIDLLVMGAYGHSRLREMVLGGVTRQLLAAMTVPVLMAH